MSSISTTRPENVFALPVGYKLMNYTIIRKIGQSDFGITYLVQEEITNQKLVLKEHFPFEYAMRDRRTMTVKPAYEDKIVRFRQSLECFREEVGVLTGMEHPGIVKVLSAFNALGTAYYVMPLVKGKSLKASEIINPDANNLRLCLLQLLNALEYLHGLGLLHHDINPSNIILKEDGLPVLINLGSTPSHDSAHSFRRDEQSPYLPPEEISTDSTRGPWTDLYSLGAICYYLIMGNPPPSAQARMSGEAMLPLAEQKHLHKRFSVRFLESIDKAMRIRHTERWQSAREWMDNLSAAQRAREEDERRKNEQARQEAERKALKAALQRTKSKDERIFERSGEKIFGAIWIVIWIVFWLVAIRTIIGAFLGTI